METDSEAVLTYYGYSIKDRRLRKRMSVPRNRPYSQAFEMLERASASPETLDVGEVLADYAIVQDFGDQVESLTIWYLGDDAWYAEYWDLSGVTRFFLEHRVEYMLFNAEWVSPLASKIMTRIALLTQQERLAKEDGIHTVKITTDYLPGIKQPLEATAPTPPIPV